MEDEIIDNCLKVLGIMKKSPMSEKIADAIIEEFGDIISEFESDLDDDDIMDDFSPESLEKWLILSRAVTSAKRFKVNNFNRF
jgi:hypothetical protein